MDAVCLTDIFEKRARVMRSVPFVMRGAFRSALRIAVQEIVDGTEAQCEVRTVRLETAVAVAQDAPLPWPPRRAHPKEAVGGTIETIPKWRLAHSSH